MRKIAIFTSIAALLVCAAGAYAQAADTAYVPFRVNVNAKVTAVQDDNSVSINVTGRTSGADTLKLPLAGPNSARYADGARERRNAPAVTGSRGNVTLHLPAQSYRGAEAALYSVNGKRILRVKAAATDAASGVSRRNVAPGVYTLSAKGANGGAFTTRLAHDGGKLSVNVAFDVSPAGQLAKSAAYGNWGITVSAAAPDKYRDSSYTLRNVANGRDNPRQDINLADTSSSPPLSQKDSILNHIDKNWRDYGYASKPAKYAALTFDDGPCPQTENLLAALANKKVKATFFLIGQNVRGNQSQAKAVHDAGHELASHSDGYSGLGGNTATNTINESLTAASAAIKNITGKDVTLFRAPNVEYGNNLASVCTQKGLAIIGVSVWSQDYQSGISSTTIANNVTNNAVDGGIINCHEANTAPNTIAAIPAMIDGLRAKGFWVCTVSELAIIKGKRLQPGEQYDSIQ